MVDYIRNELWIMRNGPGMKDLALLERAWGKSALQSGAEGAERYSGTPLRVLLFNSGEISDL